MDRLSYLLQRYTNKTATQAEMKELSALMDKNFEDSMNDTPGLSAQQEERIKMRYQHIVASPRRESVKTVRFRSWSWMAVAAAISLVLLIGLGLFVNDKSWFNLSVQQDVARVMGRQVIDLPDGTRVVLNKNSELKYQRSFDGGSREVTLIGEASFDVTHDPSKPFLVHTGKITTKVLGTEFNIHAYPTSEEVTVTVLRGLVEVRDETQVYGQLRPNEQIALNTSTNHFVRRKTHAEEALAWKKDFFILENVTFAQAALQIEKRFNVTVSITNESLKNCVVSAWFINNESLKQIVDGLSLVQHATAVIDGNKITIEGGKGCE